MGDQSAIEWTEATWGPIVGCSRVSEGCRNCYAEREVHRLAFNPKIGEKFYGLTHNQGRGPRWTGQVRLWEPALNIPLHWKKPRRIFVNSMSDLFHEKVPDGWIDRIFDVMRQARQHTFQILTKRPERMHHKLAKGVRIQVLDNVWLGVSVEDQATADERIPLLLQTPAAVRWVSYEPALGPVDFTGLFHRPWQWAETPENLSKGWNEIHETPSLNWIVVGGESGPGARPFDLAWARQTIAQGRAAGVPVFVKQLGAKPVGLQHSDRIPGTTIPWSLRDRKGGDPAEWPEDLRVREYPR